MQNQIKIDKSMFFTIIESPLQVYKILEDKNSYEKCNFVVISPNEYISLKEANLKTYKASDFLGNTEHKEISFHVQKIEESIKLFLNSSSFFKTISAKDSFLFYLNILLNHTIMLSLLKDKILDIYCNVIFQELTIDKKNTINIRKVPVLDKNDIFLKNVFINEKEFFVYKEHFLDKIIRFINQKKVKKFKKMSLLLIPIFNGNMISYIKYLKNKNKSFEVLRFRMAEESKYKEFFYSLYSFFKLSIKYRGLDILPMISILPKINATKIEKFTEKFINLLAESKLLEYKNHNLEILLHEKLIHLIAYCYVIDASYLETEISIKELNDIRVLSLASIGFTSIPAEVATKHNIKNVLISHGSHIQQGEKHADYQHKVLSKGQLDSDCFSEVVLQSPYAFNFVKEKKIKVNYSRPIMWGNSFESKTHKKVESNQLIILHASTAKELIRPVIYETAFEYIENILSIYSVIKKISNIKLLVRFRPMASISLETLKYFLPKDDCLEIVVDKTFQFYLQQSDILISYSSTTIEEAMLSKKNIILYGNDGLYCHIPNIIENSNIYHAKNEKDLEKSIDLFTNSNIENHYDTHAEYNIYEII